MNIGMQPVSEQYFNGQMTAANLLGIRAGSARGSGGGESLPGSTTGSGDRATVWWNPDSPTFWIVGVAALTLFGVAGADARLRIGRRRASVAVG